MKRSGMYHYGVGVNNAAHYLNTSFYRKNNTPFFFIKCTSAYWLLYCVVDFTLCLLNLFVTCIEKKPLSVWPRMNRPKMMLRTAL